MKIICLEEATEHRSSKVSRRCMSSVRCFHILIFALEAFYENVQYTYLLLFSMYYKYFCGKITLCYRVLCQNSIFPTISPESLSACIEFNIPASSENKTNRKHSCLSVKIYIVPYHQRNWKYFFRNMECLQVTTKLSTRKYCMKNLH